LELICFAEDDIATIIQETTGFDRIYSYDLPDTFYTKYIEQEDTIMKSSSFKDCIGSRCKYPEHSVPEYTMVNHIKTCFVRRAAHMFPDYLYYAWIDFGYIRHENLIPKSLNWEWLNDDKIHYASFETMNIDDLNHYPDPLECCQKAPDIIQGSMFIVPHHLTEWYEQCYENMLQHYQTLNLADDDQAVVLQLYKKYPQIFHFHAIPRWFGIFDYLCRDRYAEFENQTVEIDQLMN
jgi:hypothetical protein